MLLTWMIAICLLGVDHSHAFWFIFRVTSSSCVLWLRLQESNVWLGNFSALPSLIGNQRKFPLFLCICRADPKTSCSERISDLMEVAILRENKKNILSRLSVITTMPEKTDCVFRTALNSDSCKSHTFILASHQDLVDRFTAAVMLRW